MSHHQQTSAGRGRPFIVPRSLEDPLLIDIAERALWNPTRISESEAQTLAAAVIAKIRSLLGSPGPDREENAGDLFPDRTG